MYLYPPEGSGFLSRPFQGRVSFVEGFLCLGSFANDTRLLTPFSRFWMRLQRPDAKECSTMPRRLEDSVHRNLVCSNFGERSDRPWLRQCSRCARDQTQRLKSARERRESLREMKTGNMGLMNRLVKYVRQRGKCSLGRLRLNWA